MAMLILAMEFILLPHVAIVIAIVIPIRLAIAIIIAIRLAIKFYSLREVYCET